MTSRFHPCVPPAPPRELCALRPRLMAGPVLVAALLLTGCASTRDSDASAASARQAKGTTRAAGGSSASAAASAAPAAAAPPAAAPATAAAGNGPALVLRDGSRVACVEPPVVAMGRVLYRTPDGVQHAMSQDLVDLGATQMASAGSGRASDAAAAVAAAAPATRDASHPAHPERPEAPDFEATRRDGTKVKLSQLRGKVVLVDFWATWCMPCMGEMPNVKATYEKLGGADFEIVGVSLDQQKTRLDAYLSSADIRWPQYFDGQGWGNAVAQQYGVSSIPTAFLLDRDGRIRGRGMRGPDLEFAIAEAIGEKS